MPQFLFLKQPLKTPLGLKQAVWKREQSNKTIEQHDDSFSSCSCQMEIFSDSSVFTIGHMYCARYHMTYGPMTTLLGCTPIHDFCRICTGYLPGIDLLCTVLPGTAYNWTK